MWNYFLVHCVFPFRFLSLKKVKNWINVCLWWHRTHRQAAFDDLSRFHLLFVFVCGGQEIRRSSSQTFPTSRCCGKGGNRSRKSSMTFTSTAKKSAWHWRPLRWTTLPSPDRRYNLCVCVCASVRDWWEEIDGPNWVDDSVAAMIWCPRACVFNQKWHVLSSVPPLQFLIEVKNSLSSAVPLDWVKISR